MRLVWCTAGRVFQWVVVVIAGMKPSKVGKIGEVRC